MADVSTQLHHHWRRRRRCWLVPLPFGSWSRRSVFLLSRFTSSQEDISDIWFWAFGFIVVWTRTHPAPRNTIEQDQNIKMMAVSHKFEGGRFVSVYAQTRVQTISRFSVFVFVAGNVPVGKPDTISARTRGGPYFFLFLL